MYNCKFGKGANCLHGFEDVDSNEMTLRKTLYSEGILYFLKRLKYMCKFNKTLSQN